MPVAKVQLPDGRIGRFEVPDGTTPEQVMEFAQRQFAGEKPRDVLAEAKADGGVTEAAPGMYRVNREEPFTGTMWPISKDAQGNFSFDPNAGIMGTLKRAFTAPGEVYRGELNPLSDEAKLRAFEMAGVISPVAASVRAGERMIPGVGTTHQTPKAKVPTAAELKAAADAGYTRARGMGVEYPAAAVKGMADDIVRTLDADGRIAEANPELFALLNKVRNPPEGSTASLQSLDVFRQRLGDIAGSGDRAKSAAATIAIKRLDDFIQAGGKAGPVAGAAAPTGAGAADLPRVGGPVAEDPALEAARLLQEARGNAAARFRSGALTGIEDTAEMRAAAANSGQNLGNVIRQRLATFLSDPDNTRGFNKEELAAIRQVVDGTASINTLRRVSNMLGGGGGLGQTAIAALGGTVGGSVAGPYGVPAGAMLPAAIGSGSRSLANRLTSRGLSKADELVRTRSPLYASRVASMPRDVPVADVKTALSRMLLSQMLMPPDPNEGGGKYTRMLMAQ